MTFTEQGYEPDSADKIHERLRNNFIRLHDGQQPGEGIDELLESHAEVLSNFQEEMLSRVYDSAFLELAEGRQLTLKARELGINRKASVRATGIAKFSSNGPVTSSQVIPEGSEIQTSGSDPIVYETTSRTTLPYIDGFENDLNKYDGDTGDASIVNDHPKAGEGELKFGAVDGSFIYRPDINIGRGDTFISPHYQEANTVAETAFCVTNSGADRYRVLVDASQGAVKLQRLESGSTDTLDTKSVAVPLDVYFDVEISRSAANEIRVKVYDPGVSGYIAKLSADESDDQALEAGGVGFGSHDSNAAKYWDEVAGLATSADIRCNEAGTVGNKPSGSINTLRDSFAEIDEVTNELPAGDSGYDLISGIPQTAGSPVESDENLRRRALDSLSGGGSATWGAVYTAVSNLDGVNSLSIFTNSTPDDNTGSGGLPPYSTELVIFGGSTERIIETLYNKMSMVDFLRLHAGVHGSEETYTIEDKDIDDTFTGRISRPVKVDLDIEIDVVTDDSFSGRDRIKNEVVDYIGGNRTTSEPIVGLGTGEDVFVSKIRNAAASVDGVVGVPSIVVDSDDDGSDNTTTNADGLDVLSVSKNEVAQVDADESAITVNVQ